MTAAGRYWSGMAVVALGALAVRAALPGAGPAVDLGLGLTLGVQGPLGWWLIRSIGTPRLLGIWAAGMLVRMLLLGLVALVVLPMLGWPPSPALPALVVLLGAGLAVEVLVLTLQPSQAEHE